ncbi:MAG TPA: lysyl oxidase family protein [Acidimicrobiales bacterium]|nr:lysyl oxidase family protein [Acidimicrobiales bacterium]
MTSPARRGRCLLFGAAALLLLCNAAVSAAEPLDPVASLPNMVPDVGKMSIEHPFVRDEATGTFVPGPPALFFDTQARNLGTVPLQLTLEDLDDPDALTLAQCVSWRLGRICHESRSAAGFTFHADHKHFHHDFAVYELRRLLRSGKVDYSSQGLVAAAEKVSWCMADSARVSDDALLAPVYVKCESTVQGVSPGWAAVHSPDGIDQQLSLAGLTDGRYALVIDLDPGDAILETDDTDNLVEITLELSGGVTQVAAVARHYPGRR